MDCSQFRVAIFQFLDDELEPDRFGDFQGHVRRCGHCHGEFTYVSKLLVVVRQQCIRQVAPEDLRVKILTSLRRGAANRRV